MGDYISAGPDFFFKSTAAFSSNVSDVWIRGRRFLREFAKYRYGVYDLNERSGSNVEQDGLFPDFFCVGSSTSSSSGSNVTGRSIQSARGCDNPTSNENCINATTNQSTSFTTVKFLNFLLGRGEWISINMFVRALPKNSLFQPRLIVIWIKTVGCRCFLTLRL